MFKSRYVLSALISLALVYHAAAMPMSERRNDGLRRINFKDENVSKYMEGSSNQAAPFDSEAWNALLRETDAEQEPVIREKKDTLKNGVGQEFLFAKYGDDWQSQLRLLTGIYVDAVQRLGYGITSEEAESHVFWGIDAHLLKVLEGKDNAKRLQEVEQAYKLFAGV